ncbi:MAG: polysaccharide deacetylase family protein [Woeseia sp.]|nr:polysaccharide deacetylase family protein [Woeseia sp.]MBT8095729.1 polysaccharide deacetylase family protein [Woeseia sp.]NNE62424.1 polysaccharide deacetylase family protein [Woeseia sp.]NNL55365.1 polysaccharide deacetylase family protein [Woeseia sp.]
MRHLLLTMLLITSAYADDHAVILIYHHVAKDTPESTSVTPATFARHLAYIEDNGFQVLPLQQILDTLKAGEPLPDNSLAITFDDAYRSVYNIARPMLEVRRLPYTVFVNTAYIDSGYGNYMTWEQLRRISRSGATIGNHGVIHESALQRSRNETQQAWLQRFRDNAVLAQNRISEETGTVARLFAWPYGEFNAEVEQVIDELGWYGVGQQSGAVGYGTPLTAVPRYPISTNYADERNFALRVNSEPLPVAITRAPDHLLGSGDPAPELAFRLQNGPFRLSSVSCYNSNGDRLFYVEGSDGELSVQSPSPLASGRSKYTCTAPHRTKTGVFGWYSHLWVVP